MDVGLAPLTLGRPAPDVLVTAAAAAGFSRVGLTLWAPGEPLSPVCTRPDGRRTLRTHLDAAGVAVTDVGVVVLSPALDLQQVAALIGTGRALGADQVLVLDLDDDRRRALGRFRAVCDLAGQAGLQVVVEFMPYSATRTLAEAAALVAAADVPFAGVVVDVLHLYRSGGSAADVAAVAPGTVRLVQLCDATREAPPAERLREEALTDRRYPGEGELPLPELLAVVPPGARLTVEAPVARHADRSPAERAAAAAAALRRMAPLTPGRSPS